MSARFKGARAERRAHAFRRRQTSSRRQNGRRRECSDPLTLSVQRYRMPRFEATSSSALGDRPNSIHSRASCEERMRRRQPSVSSAVEMGRLRASPSAVSASKSEELAMHRLAERARILGALRHLAEFRRKT